VTNPAPSAHEDGHVTSSALRHFSGLRDVAGRSDAELGVLVEQAVGDVCDEYEQFASFHVVIEEHLAVPFRTTVLGVEVTVTKINLLSASGIVAICSRGKHRQAIGILDLPLPAPPSAGTEWVRTGSTPGEIAPTGWTGRPGDAGTSTAPAEPTNAGTPTPR
jgi:hypothetical protein